MNQPLSVYELIANASLLVQGVMGLLVIASVVSWMMILQRWNLLRRAKQEIDSFEDHFWSGIDLRSLYQELSEDCLLYTPPSPRDATLSRMPSSA